MATNYLPIQRMCILTALVPSGESSF